ncbi:MAG: hypothetical protein QOH24_655 [Verrucomicrobiota bacterium]
MPQDYVLRLIEQIAQILSAIVALRKAGRNDEALEQIAAACQDKVGIPLELVRRSSPETLLQLLETGGALRHVRGVMLAELLIADAAISENAHKRDDGVIARAQAYALLSDALPYLESNEQSIYREKMESLRIDRFPSG